MFAMFHEYYSEYTSTLLLLLLKDDVPLEFLFSLVIVQLLEIILYGGGG